LSYERLNEASNNMMKEFSRLIVDGNTESMENHQHKLKITGLVVTKIKDELIQVMREELFQI
jgi:hypothetical protein